MIKPEQVPEEVWIALRDHVRERPYGYDYTEAIAAALNAWPGLKLENLCGWVMDGPDLPYVEETASIILPLPEAPEGRIAKQEEGGDE